MVKKPSVKSSIYEIEVEEGLKKRGIGFEREFRFRTDRKFRFDFALTPLKVKIALEVEGGIYMGKGHTGGKHFESDCEKYNLAALDGWLVLRYTPSQIPQLWKDLQTIMEKKQK